MIGKLTKGKSFYTIVSYILDSKKGAQLIDSEGVLTANNQDIISSFNIQAKLNPRLGLCVGHTSLNFHKNDLPKLTNEFIVQIAKEYLEQMGITNTQYIIGRHYDKEHPHIHICYNRVNNEGKTISDKHEKKRNAEITNALTIKYNLYYASGKENVKTHRLREPYRTQHEIYDIVAVASKECRNWSELVNMLEKQGIETTFKQKRQSSDIQGVSFTKNGYTFSGSKIDKSLSYSKLSKRLDDNNNIEISNSKSEHQDIEALSSFTPYLHLKDFEDNSENIIPNKKKRRKNNNKGLKR